MPRYFHSITANPIECLYWVDRDGNKETIVEIHVQKDQIEVYLSKFELGK